MDRQTLDLFCRQLAHWADGAIESGHLPFRRTERFFPLLTAAGEIAPPLLFWINRDSCMAGGVMLFPSRAADEMLAEGCACAEALGLRHFVTWAAKEIVIWEARGESAAHHLVLPMPATDLATPDDFCDIFRALLDQLKPLCIAGAVAPAELSPFYLANLCRLTLSAVTPALAEAFRIADGEDPGRERAPATAALQQAHLLLLRLLALLIEDRLPPAIDPDGFDRALHFALDALPSALRRPLDSLPWEVPLPPAAAVRLQHLHRRLTQLRFAGDRRRGRQMLEILLQNAGSGLGGAPLPLPEESPTAGVVVNPDRSYPASEIIAEVASPALLACTAVLRHLREEPAVLQAAQALNLGEIPAPALVRGTLFAGESVTPQEKRLLAMRLRLSWPHRRFQLPFNTPRWMYEFLHLLGLAAENSRIVLDLPDDWLTTSYGGALQAILKEQFAVARLERRSSGLRIDLRKSPETVETTSLLGTADERVLPWARLREEPPSFLPLALDLAAPLFDLLRQGKLTIAAELPVDDAAGIHLFSRSSIGRALWQIVGGGRPLPARSSLLPQLQRAGFPLPDSRVLCHLQALFSKRHGEPARAAIDRELANWLDIDRTAVIACSAEPRRGTRRAGSAPENLLEQIYRTVFADGLPRFPEQFLYEHYRPQLVEYRFSGPLTPGDEFLGQQQLFDPAGQLLTVHGSETARALVLASYGGRQEVSLPAERQLTARILDRYLESLRTLRRSLVRESHRLLTDSRTADAVADKLWERAALPPWPLIAD